MKLHTSVEGSGPDLVLVHGLTSHSAVWDDIAPLLAKSWRVTRLDLPGHGQSECDYGLANLETLADSLNQNSPETAIWVGWSMGGLAALKLALLHPVKVQKLVLITTTPKFDVAEDWPHGITAEIWNGLGLDFQDDYKKSIKQYLAYQIKDSDHAKIVFRHLLKLANTSLPTLENFQAGVDILHNADLRHDMEKLECPVRFIMGDHDAFVPKELGQAAARMAPDGRCTVIPGSSHLPFISHPEIFLEELTAAILT